MSTKTKFKVTLAAVAAMSSVVVAQTGNTDYTVPLTGLGTNKTLDMIYVEGGTYQRGRSTGDNSTSEGETPVHNVTLSNYYVGKYEITSAQWAAVMGGDVCVSYGGYPNNSCVNQPKTTINWYDAVAFTCKLGQQTGKKYRLLTDAEFEYAARGGKHKSSFLYSGSNTASDVAVVAASSVANVGSKNPNALGTYDMSGNVYEWVYDSWQSTYDSGDKTNPTGPATMHTQKTRRGGAYDQPASESRVSARKIRSIEGADGSIGFRLALSADDSYPGNMVDPCDIHQPPPSGGPKGFHDDRLITADDEVWAPSGGYGNLLIIKEHAAITASVITFNGTTYVTEQAKGEWYTLNSFSLNIVSSSGSVTKYIYYLIDRDNMSMMPDGEMPGRYERKKIADVSGASKITVPTIANPKTPEQLAPAGYNVDMSNPPTTGRDSRLIEGTANAWLQDNVKLNAGGTHRYRFDFDSEDEARFVVYDVGAMPSPTYTGLARGSWFTVDNNFLRISKNGRNYDYLYTVTSNGNTYYHISYQGYEPGDFRVFEKVAASDVPGWQEPTSYVYENGDIAGMPTGASTYVPPSDDNVMPSSSSEANSSSSVGDSPSSSSTMVSSSSEAVTPILHGIATSNKALQIQNGVDLQAVNGATLEIYSIRGSLMNRQSYAAGRYSVSFAHLPKGMYVVKVKFGGSNVKMLRVPVM